MIAAEMRSGIVAMRPFVPARDFALSLRFYEAIGFSSVLIGDQMAHMQLGEANGSFSFLLQNFYVKAFAENFMMHLLVDDLDAWWRHIDDLALGTSFGVQPPKAPALQPWGMRVAYLFDPSGVLWHLAQDN